MDGGMILAIITYLWEPDERSNLAAPYTPDDVRRLQKSVSRNLMVPHKFLCVTDHRQAFDDDSDIEAVAIDETIPKNAGHCVLKLMTFHPEGREIFDADAVFHMDLDTAVTGLIDPVVSRHEDVVLWRNPARVPWANPARLRPHYNSSFVYHRCGSLPWVWKHYLDALKDNPGNPALRDDQTWLSCAFGPNAPYWDGKRDGIYRLAREDTPGSGVWGDLPGNAVLVTFPGSEGKPDNPRIRDANPWIAEMGL